MKLSDHVAARVALSGAAVSADQLTQLTTYLELLRHWNRRINLSGFDLEVPSDAAIDRLIVEGVAAGDRFGSMNQIRCDLGSGAGSPAIPMLIMKPAALQHLIEVRSKKAAFLREVARELQIAEIEVHAARFQDVAPDLASRIDLISLRAMALGDTVWSAIRTLLGSSGRVLWFGGGAERVPSGGFEVETKWLGSTSLVVADRR